MNDERPAGLPRDLGAGLLLILVAAVGGLGTGDLSMTEAGGIGPGLMPRGVSVLLALVGVVVTLMGITARTARVRFGSLRGPVFVLGSVVLFAATVRPMGLAIAGPLAVVVAALADPDSKPLEILIFAAVMTVFCVGLFKYALRLPIPLAPMLIGY
jgi:hypothetical protein